MSASIANSPNRPALLKERRRLSFGALLLLSVASPVLLAAQEGNKLDLSTPGASVEREHAQAAIERAKGLIASGALQDAENTLRAALTRPGEPEEVQRFLAYVLYRENKPRESLEAYTAAARTRTPGPEDLKAVAFDYVLLGDYSDADKWLTRVTSTNPQDADAWYYLARTKYSENRFAEAVEAFGKSLALRPRDVRSEDNLGLAYQGLNRPDEALQAFRTAIDWQRDAPKQNAQPYLNLGILLTDRGDPQAAVQSLQQATRLAPANPKAHEQLGRAYQQLGRFEEARVELERAVQLAPDVSGLHFQLGQVYRRLGSQEKAKQEFARCAELNGAHSTKETPNPVAQ